MLEKKLRLPASVVFSNAKSIHTVYFSLRVQKNNLTTNRYGFIISKKTARLSVVRNQTKRRLRSCVENHLPKPTGIDALFVIKKNAVGAAYQDIEKVIVEVFSKGLR